MKKLYGTLRTIKPNYASYCTWLGCGSVHCMKRVVRATVASISSSLSPDIAPVGLPCLAWLSSSTFSKDPQTSQIVGSIDFSNSRLNNAFKWAQNEIAVVPDFHKRILFSNEAHFWLNGYVNKQNCRIWSETNPQVYVETPLHPEKLTVWCALWAGGIIGPYFFKIDEGLISRSGPVNWPPSSCDLTPLDYFLWGYVKSLVYADKPQTLDHLEDNIRRVIADIRPQMLEKVIENWTSDWTTSEPAVAVVCQKSCLKCNATSISFE
ncbi:putative transposable element [Trichonephila clavipes]|nr:putative transposable element [Trichonephila clavipes]